MPFTRIWVHLIWSTTNRQCIINKTLKPKLLAHIWENAKRKQIYIDRIDCVEDHCHALISLGASQSISKVAFLIKGESSFWINDNGLVPVKFEWQDEYLAVSVSESQLEKVRSYIKNQDEHHKRRTFKEEYDLFIKNMSNYLG